MRLHCVRVEYQLVLEISSLKVQQYYRFILLLTLLYNTIQSWSSVGLVREPLSEKRVSLSGHSLRDHTSCSPFHTVIQSVCGLRFPPPPHCSLFFLQPLFFWVRLVPSPVLHQLLVWSQTAVGQSYTLLLLIQGQCQRREVVHVLSILSEEQIDESKTLLCNHNID